MADQTITPVEIPVNTITELATGDYETITAADDGYVTIPKDGKYILHMVDASGGAVVTIEKGTGWMHELGVEAGAAMTQVAVTAAGNNFAIIDGARFKNLSTGKVKITSTASVLIACIYIP